MTKVTTSQLSRPPRRLMIGRITPAMVDPHPLQSALESQDARQWRLKGGEIALQVSALLAALAALIWLLAPIIHSETIPLDWQPRALLCAAALLSIGAVT